MHFSSRRLEHPRGQAPYLEAPLQPVLLAVQFMPVLFPPFLLPGGIFMQALARLALPPRQGLCRALLAPHEGRAFHARLRLRRGEGLPRPIVGLFVVVGTHRALVVLVHLVLDRGLLEPALALVFRNGRHDLLP